MTTQTFSNVTLYTKGDSMNMNLGNIRRIECRTLTVSVEPYAQHENGIKLTFVPKGKRVAREMSQSSFADVVILAGHGHMDPDGAFLPERPGSTPGVTVAQGRDRSCDTRWQGDFDAKLAEHLTTSGATVLADFRGHVFENRRTW